MNAITALALYPVWAVATAVGFTAMRLGRQTGRGLVSLCFCLALWITSLILLNNPATTAFAEHIAPSGLILSAGFLHAAADIAGLKRRKAVRVAYAVSAAFALLGMLNPHLLYAPGARAPGPLFLPVAAACAVGLGVELAWLARLTFAAEGRERRRRAAIAIGCLVSGFGGGGAIGLRVLGRGEIELAAPMLLIAVLLAAYAVLSSEHGRARRLVLQGLAYATVTATMSAFGLVAFYLALPHLTPGHGASIGWLMFVTFFIALPLDPFRHLAVETVGRALFRDPIGVRDLSEQIERSEARADHAERLAEIGRLASAVAHEIRNPLGVIAAQTKLLERAGASATSLAAVRAQVERARRFLDDLLRYSRPRPLEVTEVDALPALQLAAANVRQVLGDGAPPIDVRHIGRGGVSLEVDRGAFNDVATVLMHNAAIAVSDRDDGSVSVEVKRDGGAVIVAVEDNGPGVPPELEATLFQPFVTGRGRDAKHPGTGLGLAIAMRWVERHGGKLSYERAERGGARFLVRWPRGGGREQGARPGGTNGGVEGETA